MTKRRKPRRTARSLPTPVWVGGIVGLVLIAVGLVLLTGRQAAVPGNIPYPEVPRISPAEAYDQQQSGKALIIDVRDSQFYQEAHAAGALSLPEDEILTRMDELPTDKTLILY